MKTNLSLAMLFFTLSTLMVNAQNYNPIVNGNTSIFGIEFDGDYTLHVDSVSSDPKGTAYHFSKTWSEKTSACNTYYRSLWTGPKCIVSQNTCYFFNQTNDTITFMPSAALNSKWMVYRYSDGRYIEGEITAKNYTYDSTKTIRLQCKNVDGSNIAFSTSTPTGYTYVFSKNNGIIELTNFDTFPNDLSRYTLGGMTNNEVVGYTLITPRTIFNFEIGDEFHYQKVYSNPPLTYTLTNTIRKVIDISGSVTADEVTYTFQQRQEKHTQEPIGSAEIITYLTDTISETHYFNLPVYYPGQAITESNPLSFYFGMSSVQQFRQLNNPLPVDLIAQYDGIVHNEECWNFQVITGFTTISFLDNCGLLSRIGPEDNGIGEDREDLVYCKTSKREFGSPLLLSTYSKGSNTQLSLFPNPLKQGEELHWSSEQFHTVQVKIYNGTGNKIIESVGNHTVLDSIDVSKLQPGLYTIQLINEKNEYISAKLIIK
ncbi:MAG: T9SS type A sorting domain-containing protein [Cytophagaceae bacterium]|nr:T9SS type A sorting domain-containing protein [Cytophagaceae bacterium]